MPSLKIDYAARLNREHPCPPNEPGAPCINLWFMSAARKLRLWGCKAERALAIIESLSTRTEKYAGEIARAVSKVYDTECSSSATSAKRETFSPYGPELLAAQAAKTLIDVTDEWLAAKSPVDVSSVTPSGFLDSIFRAGECVAVMNEKMDPGFIYRVGRTKLIKPLERYVAQGSQGAWYVSNPVNGERIDGGLRREANITDFRHLLMESDKAPRDLWLKMIVQVHAPILALYESGGRSVHAIIRVDAANKAEFDSIANGYRQRLCPLGADPNSGKAVQPTRLPGVTRNDNGREQRLLYLNPNADGSPIYQPKFVPLF